MQHAAADRRAHHHALLSNKQIVELGLCNSDGSLGVARRYAALVDCFLRKHAFVVEALDPRRIHPRPVKLHLLLIQLRACLRHLRGEQGLVE